MKLVGSLTQEINFHLEYLFQYVQDLRKTYELLSEEEVAQKLTFLKSFETKMRVGLQLILEKEEYFTILEKIRHPEENLLKINKKRYLDAIITDKGPLDQRLRRELEVKCRKIPLIHATKNKELLHENVILTAANLCQHRIKTCANAMDIALGLHFFIMYFLLMD